MKKEAKRMNYNQSPEQLKRHASLFWPKDLLDLQQSASIIPLLVGTQEKFLSILDVAERSPESWKTVLQETTEIPANLFLKHLMVLADVGGEPLKRLRRELSMYFPDGRMTFLWRESTHEYVFKKILSGGSLDNKALFVDGKSLACGHELTDAMSDIIMLLLYGSTATALPDVIGEKCLIGNLIGNKIELQKFVRQRYILVSRITAGATANELGQIAQNFVRDLLQQRLETWAITRNGQILGISQNDGKTDMDFDVVARSPEGRYVAIEVSYQVTTNSTIERKAGQAKSRHELLHRAGHKIAYVIDGAGNFERASALQTICNYSDCTVAFSPAQIDVLAEYLIRLSDFC